MLTLSNVVAVLLLVVYGLVANALAARALRHRINTDEPVRGHQIWYAENFSAEGLKLRRVALSFIVLGGIVVLLIWIL